MGTSLLQSRTGALTQHRSIHLYHLKYSSDVQSKPACQLFTNYDHAGVLVISSIGLHQTCQSLQQWLP